MILAGLQKLSLLDFPGKMCCTVFTLGCNFRCPFCHNGTLVVDTVNTPTISEEEFFSYLKKRSGILEGVCISGGEPLIHDDIEEFIEKIKSLGYAVKLDTNGSFPDKLMSLAAKGLVDYVAMDIKSSDDGYSEATGLSNPKLKDINRSIDFLMQGTVAYEFRTTVVRELHTKDDLRSISERIKGADKYSIQSFVMSDDVINKSLSAYSAEELNGFADIFKDSVKEFVIK